MINIELLKNTDISREIQKSEFRGTTPAQRKPLYVKRNTFDVSVDKPIYRIFQFHNFIEDLKNNQLTLVRPLPEIWGDPLENPLKDYQFTDETGGTITLNGIMEKYWALSWTEDDTESLENWKEFSHNRKGIKIKTTIYKLLDRIMETKNVFFMLDYFIGKIKYYPAKDIVAWLKTKNYKDFLDSLGQATVLSLMAIRDNFSTEKEIRLIYSYGIQDDNTWVKDNIKIENKLCRHPFSWDNIIDEIILDPRTNPNDDKNDIELLNILNIHCPIGKSGAK